MIDDNYDVLAQIYAIVNYNIDQKSIAMKEVLEKDFDINYRVPSSKCKLPNIVGRTALDFALEKRVLDVFEMLLRRGANFTNTNQNGSTILHRIIEKSYVSEKPCHELKGMLKDPFVESVLSAHIQLNKLANPYNQDGISHFHIACMFNYVDAVRFFLEQGVRVNRAISRDSKIFPSYTPLHLAARYSAFETAKLLLDYGADANLRNFRDMYPLFLLIERNSEILDWQNVQKKKLCEKLKEEFVNNDNIIGLLVEKFKNNEFCLSRCQVACTLQDRQVLEQMMTEGPNLNDCVDKNSPIWPGYTALHFAAIFNIDAVKLLVMNGADIMAKDANGVTPFDLCVQRYSLETLHSIVTIVPELNEITFNDAETKLADFLIYMIEKPMFRSFLQINRQKVNMSLPYDSPLWPGYSILHIAVILSHRIDDVKNLYEDTDYALNLREKWNYLGEKDCFGEEYFKRIEICLQEGVDVSGVDSFNSTPIHLAFRLQNRHIVELLLDHHNPLLNIVDSDNLSHLHIACTVEDSGVPQRLLATGVEVNLPIMSKFIYKLSQPDFDLGRIIKMPKVLHINPGWTCLHTAVASSNMKLVNILMNYGADLYAKDSFEMTAVHYQVLRTEYDDFSGQVSNMLSEDHYDDRMTDFGLSHLHVACFVGDIKSVTNIIIGGSDIEAKINYKLVRSNPALQGLAPYDGYTPLHFALKGHQVDVVKLLVQRGANFFSKTADGSIPFYETLKSPFDIDYKLGEDFLNEENERYDENKKGGKDDDDDVGGNYYEYDYSENALALRLLNDRKIEEIVKENSGITKLHVACWALRSIKILKLLENGADPNAQIHVDSPIWPGSTPLHALMAPRFTDDHDEFIPEIYEKIEIIGKRLLKHGACVTLKDAEGNTPIHKAHDLLWSDAKTSPECLGLIGWILNGHSDFKVNPVNPSGMSHFDVACMTGHKQVVKRFLKHGVDVNRHFGHFSEYYGGFTALHLACLYKDNSMVEILLKNGANYRARDFLGNTPLHIAVMYCRLGVRERRNELICEILLEAGADGEAKNLFNEIPSEVFEHWSDDYDS